jgi:GT2 family glycosyltransferase
MASATPPRLSVVLPVLGGPEVIARTLQCLAGQTIAHELELLLITADPDRFAGVAADVPELGAVRVLTGDPEHSTGCCRAQGVRQAGAAHVAYTEDHCHPEPGWAAGMLAAFEPGVAGVCPDLRNGNRGSRIATADHFVNFASLKAARAGEDLPDLAGRNGCYRRDALLALGAELESLTEIEFNLHTRLRQAGWTLRLAPQAVAHHRDISDLRTALGMHLNLGRLLTARRSVSEQWSRWRRLAHAVGWPLIPPLRLWRMRRVIAQHRDELLGPLILGTMLLLMSAAALGELLGVLRGAGQSARILSRAEFLHS